VCAAIHSPDPEMPSIESVIAAAAKVPWPRRGSLSASALLLWQFNAHASWAQFAMLAAAMLLLIMLPFLAELLHRRYIAREPPTHSR
jgi:hypothetical protein